MPRKPGQQQLVTLKTIADRSIAVGDCLEWQNYMSSNRQPMVRHNGKATYVRRLVVMLEGREPAHPWVTRLTCGNDRCVHGPHIKTLHADAHMATMHQRVDFNHPVRIAKLQRAASPRRTTSDAAVMQVLTDPRPAVHVAAELGISASLARKIRAGKALRQVSAAVNPFAAMVAGVTA